MKRADPNIWLYCALFSYALGSSVIGALCVLLHMARVPAPRGPKRKPRKR